ncbi:MAG TPA: hypothetical protein VEM41_09170, partial [Actinomycetota bacterium]|nr:hypothetical protein [Actinomycetota bacterium]
GLGVPPSSSVSRVGGYWLSLPPGPRSVTSGSGPGVALRIVVTTDLPEGTIVSSTADAAWGVEPGVAAVHRGSFVVRVGYDVCQPVDAFDLRIVVRPFYEALASHGGRSWYIPAPTQPRRIVDLLGDRFQNLTGSQVTSALIHRERINQIVVRRTYAMPPLPRNLGFSCDPGFGHPEPLGRP